MQVNGNSRDDFWGVSETHPGALSGLGHYLGEAIPECAQGS